MKKEGTVNNRIVPAGVAVIVVLMMIMGAVTGFKTLIRLYTDIRTAANRSYGIDDIIDDWNNHVAMKGRLGSVDSMLSYYSLHDLDSRRVILGKDNWLFFRSSDNDEEGTIGDYTGQNIPDEEGLRSICDHVLDMQDKLSERGVDFTVVIGPNKSSVYYEYMPDDIVRAEYTRTDMICEYLREQGVNIVNPKISLTESKKLAPLYYKYDTHWNQLGAYIACKEALSGLGMSIPDIDPAAVTDSSLQYHYCAFDDLADMVGMKQLIFNDEQDYVLDYIDQPDWGIIESEQRYGTPSPVSHFENPNAMYDTGLLFVGDSFRIAMISPLSNYVSDVYVISHEGYDPRILDEIGPDCVLFECVERDSEELGSFDLLEE